MSAMVRELSVDELRAVIRETVEHALEDKLEDLEGLTSVSYLRSIEEARADVRAGRTIALDELLDG